MTRRKKAAEPGRNGTVAPAATIRLPEEPKKERLTGRLASELTAKNVEWLQHPWIPKGMLTMVVGHPNVGKSTFLAALIAAVTNGLTIDGENATAPGRVVVLPGSEEDPETLMLPRLQRARAQLHRIKLLDGSHLSILRDKDRLAGTVDSFGAVLLVGDPIDSYVGEPFSEDRGQDVRPMLEAAEWIGHETGAAVIFARHPGKDLSNICPGSRQWRAVPRIILQLASDGNFPPSYMLSHWKDKLGTGAKPRRYTLEGEPGEAKLFKLAEEMERSAEELAEAGGGPVGRYRLMQACRLIRWLFQEEETPTRQALGTEARAQGLGEDTVNEALRLLGIQSVPSQHRDMPWKLVRVSQEWPKWLPEVTPP